MKTIQILISEGQIPSIVTPQPLVEGENLTTEIAVTPPDVWAGYAIRCLLTTPKGVLVDPVDASVPVGLTNTMLDGKGILYVEFVAMKGGTEIDRTVAPALLPVSGARSLIGEIDPAPLPDLVAEMVNAKNTALDAAESCAEAEQAAEEGESARGVAEGLRVTAETSRETAEGLRVTAEQGRVTAEGTRASAETSRETAESGRVTAENGRVSAEAARVTAEQGRAALPGILGNPTAGAMTNLVAKGDFSSGITGWTGAASTISGGSGVLVDTASGTYSDPTVYQILSNIINHKVYVRAKVRSTNTVCQSIVMRCGATVAVSLPTPVQNTWNDISGIGVSNSDSGVRITHNYANAATASGKIMEVQYVLAIDLTAIFGAGKEPTAAEMDRLLAFYPNSFFSGNADIMPMLRALMSGKANKTQETWITASLLNSWVVYVGETPAFRKTTTNRLEFYGAMSGGTNGTICFVLPAEYRPAKPHLVMARSASGVNAALSIDINGNVTVQLFNTYLALDGLSIPLD